MSSDCRTWSHVILGWNCPCRRLQTRLCLHIPTERIVYELILRFCGSSCRFCVQPCSEWRKRPSCRSASRRPNCCPRTNSPPLTEFTIQTGANKPEMSHVKGLTWLLFPGASCAVSSKSESPKLDVVSNLRFRTASLSPTRSEFSSWVKSLLFGMGESEMSGSPKGDLKLIHTSFITLGWIHR